MENEVVKTNVLYSIRCLCGSLGAPRSCWALLGDTWGALWEYIVRHDWGNSRLGVRQCCYDIRVRCDSVQPRISPVVSQRSWMVFKTVQPRISPVVSQHSWMVFKTESVNRTLAPNS